MFSSNIDDRGINFRGKFMRKANFIPEITDDLVKMYDDYLVPSIYAQWGHHLIDIAALELGHDVLDAACRTGTVTCTAQLEVGFGGKVTGLDHNEEMLAIASKKNPRIDWQLGNLAALPFEDNSFDRVLCQFALMFIHNRVAATKEMLRVCKPDGQVIIAIWAPLDHSKGYTALVNLIRQYAGERAASNLASPWSLGVPGKMDALLLSAGVNEYECHERVGLARFPSVESFVEVNLRSAGEFHKLGEEDSDKLMSAAGHVLAPFVVSNGEIIAELNANVFVIYPD
ncbi:MAG: hypothetical protein BMS9Abin30_0206 [Gammaproteobacteria bacterium]|nr:MAG: hypothetical protein BMS9Abin30_0206 [Gammaproteobacteria bacterium]